VEVAEGKVAKVATAGMRLVMNERVGVRLVWVSADGRDAEYEVVRRFEQPAEEQPKVAEPVGFEGQHVPRPDREVIEPVADSELVETKEESEAVAVPTAAEQATEGAEDYLEKARRQAYEWASRG
jgi:transcription antitermination factor NusG